MDRVDKYLKSKCDIENKEFILPKSFEYKLEETLENLDKIDIQNNWYKNKKILATVACFIFICVGISINIFNNNSMDYSESIPNLASSYSRDLSGEMQEDLKNRVSKFSLSDESVYNFIEVNNIDRLYFKSIEDNKYKIIHGKEDIEEIINFINNISREKTEVGSMNDWKFLIQASGVDINHSIIIGEDIIIIDEEYYKISSKEINDLKDIYNSLSCEEIEIPYCDIK